MTEIASIELSKTHLEIACQLMDNVILDTCYTHDDLCVNAYYQQLAMTKSAIHFAVQCTACLADHVNL